VVEEITMELNEIAVGPASDPYMAAEWNTAELVAVRQLAFDALAVQDPNRAAEVWRARGDESPDGAAHLSAIVAAMARQNVEAAQALAAEAGLKADDVRRGAVESVTTEPRLALDLTRGIQEASFRGYALQKIVWQDPALWSHTEGMIREIMDLAADIPTDSKIEVMGALAETLVGRSTELQSDTLLVAALAERSVFLDAVEPFARVVASVIGSEAMLTTIENVRGVLEDF
jgi:hypothetical protein